MRYYLSIKSRLYSLINKLKINYTYKYLFNTINSTEINSIEFFNNHSIYKLSDGRKYIYDPSELVSRLYSIPFTGTFESKETNYIKSIIEPGWTCIDVGACFGWYSVLLSRLTGVNGLVYSFEPIKNNYKYLIGNIEANSLTNVHAFNFALGEKDDSVNLYLPKKGVSGALKAHQDIKNCEVLNVQIRSFDNLLNADIKGVNAIDFIKVDIEGAELLFLKGAFKAIKKYKPILMLEVQINSTKLYKYSPSDLYNLLSEIGYEVYRVDKNGSLINFGINFKRDNLLGEYNFIFKKKE